MSLSVTVALAANAERDFAAGLRSPDDFRVPWDEHPQIRLQVEEGEYLGVVLERAADDFDVHPPHWVEGGFAAEQLAFVDFYRPDAQQILLRRELALIDQDGRANWTKDWRTVPYRQLLRAESAGTLRGDPQRVYLLLQPGIGNGALSDFVTLAELWSVFWDVLQFVWNQVGDEALKGFGLYQLWKWAREHRLERTPEILRGHLDDWRARGMRPDNLRDLIGSGPWMLQQVASVLGCSEEEAEALLIGYGSVRTQDGLWRPADEPVAKFLQDTMDLLIHLPAADRARPPTLPRGAAQSIRGDGPATGA